jgi:flagellar hook-associated protein 3 FlgL
MRIATAHTYDATIDSLMKQATDLSSTQGQISSNARVNKASDDPVAAAQAERDNAALQTNTANTRAVGVSQTAMQLTDSALGTATDLVTSARTALVNAGNGTYSSADRATLADQLTSYRQQLLAAANSTNGSGQYLFGGQDTTNTPFLDATGGVQYQGTSGETDVASGQALPISVDGGNAWMQAPTGNGTFATSATTSTGSAWIDRGTVTDPSALTGSNYSIQFSVAGGATTYSVLKDGVATAQAGVPYVSGQAIAFDGMSMTVSGTPANGDEFAAAKSTNSLSVFDALDKAITALKDPTLSNGQVQQAVSSGIGDMDQSLNRLSAVRGQVGATLNRIDNVTSNLADTKLAAQTDHSNQVDLDMASAISSLSTQQTNYQVALQAYASVQKLSLFNYLN